MKADALIAHMAMFHMERCMKVDIVTVSYCE